MMSSVYHFCLYGLAPLLFALLVQIGPAEARECLDCHGGILGQLKSSSHHIQGTAPNSRHCYACHWEATAGGEIDERYHQGKDGRVDLVVWQDGSRPAEYLAGRTAVPFLPAAMGTKQEREEVSGITSHCLSCHNDTTGRTATFSGDPNTPAAYAWDKESIDSRYSSRKTTTWGKYSTPSTNKKQRIIKALSPHGNAAANQGGWREAVGYDGDMPLSRGGSTARNVECYDCHNSHGSNVPGITSSYRVAESGFSGGILKQTTAGSGGYRVTYQPSANSYAKSKNPFSPGAGLCFDCHETATAEATPWGYNATFGLTKPVMGYKDTPGFGPGTKGSSGRFPNRQGRDDVVSSHLKSGTPLHANPTEKINGLCTPCHDPHGVSRTLGEKMAYAVPLLKGSWLTSPYREDGPPAGIPGRTGSGIPAKDSFNSVNRDAGSNFAREGSSAPRDNYNSVNRDAGSNFAKGESTPPRSDDYNAVNRSAGSNFAREGSSAPRSDYNAVNRDAGSNFAKGESTPPRSDDFNAVNRSAGSNFAREGSSAPRSDYNSVNRDAGSNFAKSESTPPRSDDYNTVNRSAGSNFAREGSSAPRGDYNAVNRDAGSNFAKGESTPPRSDDYNAVNRSSGSNFAREGSSAPRSDYNSVNRDAGSNFAKGESTPPRSDDFNAVNRSAGSNFAREGSSAPRDDYNSVNRNAGSNFTRATENASREMDANRANRDANSNFAKSGMGAPREPMQGMKYNVDRNTFGDERRISENDDHFAGLCLKCHSRESLTAQNGGGMIHRTVKGWGSNKEHSFPCSKCHQAHNSGLPRLMQTNCFEQGPGGLRENSGISWLPYKKGEAENGAKTSGKAAAQVKSSKIVGCHVKQFGKATAGKQQGGDGGWKEVTQW